jgi:hypothetical protein
MAMGPVNLEKKTQNGAWRKWIASMLQPSLRVIRDDSSMKCDESFRGSNDLVALSM